MSSAACPICMMEPEDGEEWYEPPCDKRHIVHYECMVMWKNKRTDSNSKLFCTLCRNEFKFEEGTKRTIKTFKEVAPVNANDAFGADDEKN